MTHDYRKRPEYSRKDQYFPKDIVVLKKDEVFVDCGAYTGDTVIRFLKETDNRYKKIVAFEPDKINIKSLAKIAKDMTVIKAAVWDHDTEVSFEEGGGSGSRVQKGGTHAAHLVQAKAIDNTVECADASFIKMDIEGSEYQALQGAYHTIRRNRPTLAICIYHSDEDMLRIIELIHGWQLGYRLYIRHHAETIAETVLYAVQ